MKYIVYAWAGLAILSMAVYAFTGHTAWVPLDPQGDGGLRFFLLLAIHIGWAPAMPWAVDHD